jgi:hypothetical protein
MTRRSDIVGAMLALIAVAMLYAWIAAPARSQLGPLRAKDAYYNQLADGFLRGQLHLAREVPAGLATLADPYDPYQNGPYRIHDASYYDGKLHLYFGASPTLVLFIPYRLLTGEYLWHRQAVAVFAVLMVIGYAWIVLYWRRRLLPESGPIVTGMLVLGAGLGGLVPVMLRRPDVWEVPIACAAACNVFALGAVLRAIAEPKRRVRWLAWASAGFGVAVAARPSVLFAAAVLLVPLLQLWWEGGRDGRAWRMARSARVGAAVPLLAAIMGIFWYNFARFEDPLEFGQKYQMAGDNQNQAVHFSAAYLWYHLRLYFWEPVKWSTYFPFVQGILPPPPPPGQLGVESPIGVLRNLPWFWLVALTPLLVWRQATAERREALWVLLTLAAAAAALTITLCGFGGACLRYQVEILPPWVLLTLFGVFGLEHALTRRPRVWRALARGSWIGLLLYTVAFNFFASCQERGLMRVQDPENFKRLARFFNRPIGWLEARLGRAPGPLELQLTLPPLEAGEIEPLLVTGFPPWADYVYVWYAAPGLIGFGYNHTGQGQVTSMLVPADRSVAHTLTIEVGGLYPPIEHPFFAGMEPEEAEWRRQRIRVRWNGEQVLDGEMPAYHASPSTRFIGHDPYGQPFGARFSGLIHEVRNRPMSTVRPEERRGPVRALVTLSPVPAGRSEPLVVTGIAGAGDAIYVRRVDDTRVIFGWDHWGAGNVESNPVELPPEREFALHVAMGSLYPAADLSATEEQRRTLEIRVDGAVVLRSEGDFHPSAPAQVRLGVNAIGVSTAQPRFTGFIRQLRRDG